MAVLNTLRSGAVLVYVAVVVIYRLWFSPLARFPGPRIAAITSLYAYYHDVIRGGMYIWEVEEMHKRYGPIIRIRPDIIHINDPEFMEQVYGAAGKRRHKYKVEIGALCMPGSILGTLDYDLHRVRRASMNPYFSKASIRKAEPIIQRAKAKIMGRLSQSARSGEPMAMDVLYGAAASDITYEFTFGQRSDYLDDDDMNAPFYNASRAGSQGFHFVSHLPIFHSIIKAVPLSFAIWVKPLVAQFLVFVQGIQKRVDEVKRSAKFDDENTSMFHGILNDPDIPESVKSTERLVDEGRVLIQAGTDTTSVTLSAITYHILANPKILKRLKAELQQAIPNFGDDVSVTQLEALPYLTAVIQEGIRIHPGASLRQERVAPDEDLVYEDKKSGKTYTILRGTAMGMTASLLSRNEDIWPSPYEFRPERFLENPYLDKYHLAFARGSRRCIGINLAYAEIYLFIGSIFRKYDLYDGTRNQKVPTLELFETSRENVEIAYDFVTPMPKRGSLGTRVKVRE